MVTNASDRLMLVFTEPEGQDFRQRPGESVELRAGSVTRAADVELTDNGEGVTVWTSAGLGYVSVWAGGIALPRGHRRPTGRPR